MWMYELLVSCTTNGLPIVRQGAGNSLIPCQNGESILSKPCRISLRMYIPLLSYKSTD